MTEQELIQVANGVVEAFNGSDWERCQAILAPDAVHDEIASARRMNGASEIIALWQSWKAAMPDLKGSVTNAVASGNAVVLEVTWQGTHTGPLVGPQGTIPASGKPQTTYSSWVLRFDRGQIQESRLYFDMLSFLQQIGVLPQ
jgi:steroid delta-isomerase-like uncharacterized protein